MPAIEQLTELVSDEMDLDVDQACGAAYQLADTAVDDSSKRAFLLALAEKGETPVEVAAIAGSFRDLAVDPKVEAWADRAIDVCGTGGDGSGSFNISTVVSFIMAASGVPVFKHGNRSVTSQCGSADLLEGLGFHLELSPDQLQASLRELNFCFFYAPVYHPAFKGIMPVRRQLAAEGKRSLFNLLGPLLNPGRPAYQLLGVYDGRWVAPLAEALGVLGLRRGLVVHGRPREGGALDELSCAGENECAGIGELFSVRGNLQVADAKLPSCTAEALQGGDLSENIELLKALVKGGGGAVPAGLRDSVLLNAGAALWIAEKADNLADGVEAARATLESGEVENWLERARAFHLSAIRL
ncbi:MAG: anthranilate phosphoribosyltransferase [Opitutales bacterium]